jgi:hypothetical protein
LDHDRALGENDQLKSNAKLEYFGVAVGANKTALGDFFSGKK